MKNTFFIVSGSAIFAMSVAFWASPAGLVSGGVSGIGIVVKEITGVIPIALTSFLLNIPLFVIGFFQRGIRFLYKSLFAFLSLTLFLGVFESLPLPFDAGEELLVSTLVYGVLSGLGIGLVLRSGATTGGTDMLASIIKKKKPHLRISFLIVIIDVAIILSGVFIFGFAKGVYATLGLFVASKVMDAVVSGGKISKSAMVLSPEYEKISERIIKELGRGVTLIEGRGQYTGEKRRLLLSVMSVSELSRLYEIVYECDKEAFITVTDAREVLGEGFGSLSKQRNSLS